MAQTRSPISPGLPIDDDFPVPDPDDIVCLGGTEVTSFSATPRAVEPFGPPVTLRWSVSVPSGCNVGLTLNGRPVGRNGSQQVQPAVTTRYTLAARLGRATKALRTLTVPVDTSACVTVPVPESLVRSAIRGEVDALDRERNDVSQRSPARVEVTTRGIEVGLRLGLAIDNFPDPDIDIDLTIGLRLRNGSLEPFYRRFDVDVDWPWWVTVISAGASKVVEEFMDEAVEDRLRPLILDAAKERIDALVDQIPGDMRLHSLQVRDGEIRVTACPGETDNRFLVLPTPDLEVDGDLAR